MADAPQVIAGAESAYVDIQARLRDITQLQDQQLRQLKDLNVQNSILSKVKAGQVKDTDRMATLQTNIVATSNRMLFLEQRRLAALASGTLAGAQNAARLQTAITDMGNRLRAANAEFTYLNRKQAAITASLGIANKIGFGALIKGSQELFALWKVHPLLAIGKVIEHAIDMFDKMDQAATRFRMSMGLTRTYTAQIDENARSIAVNLTKVGVTADHAYQAYTALSKTLFSTMSVTKEMASDTALLSAQLGITAESSAEFMKNMGIASRTTAGSQRDMTLFAAKLSEAAGVPLNEIMQDVSNATKSSYSFIARSGLQMIKAAVDAKRMGTTLDSTVKSSQKLLDFTSSVRAEMEASVLVGKSINLQHARELAYRRDLKGLNAEILRIMKDVNFEQLDPFQQEAVAAALGKSAGELANMAQAERERLGWETSSDPIIKRQLAAYKEMEKATEATAKARAGDMRLQLTQKANQAAIASITQSWNAILMKLGEKFLPIIEKTLRFIADNFDQIMDFSVGIFTAWKVFIPLVRSIVQSSATLSNFFNRIWTIARGIGTAIAGFFTGTGRFASALRAVGNFLRPVIGLFARIGGWIGRILATTGRFTGLIGSILRIGGAFVRWVPVVGWIISAVMFIYNLFKRFGEIEFVKGDWLGNIWKGIKAVGGAIYDTLLKPFVDVFKWVWDFFCGKSPSKIGLGILNGLTSVAGMLVDALFFPWKTAWGLIKKIPFVGKLFGGKNVGAEIKPETKAEVDVEKKTTPTETRTPAPQPVSDAFVMELSKKLDNVVAALNSLRDDMKAGVLTATVYLDSQKLDAGMARRIAYTGALT